jgi:uncharacterized protein (TIRG00374 family)
MHKDPTEESEVIKKAFSWWKIWVAVLLGLSIASWKMYASLTTVHFIPVEKGTGDFIWTGGKGEKTPNLSAVLEFKKHLGGDYKIEAFSDTLVSIDWTKNAFFWLFAALLCMVLRDLFYIIRIRILTKSELSWRQGFNVIMLWEFASALAPGVMSGATVAMFILKREKIPLGRSTAIVIITAFMDNLFYVILIPIVMLFLSQEYLFPHHQSASLSIQILFWIAFSIKVLLCAFLFSSLFLFPTITTRFILRLFRLPFLNRWYASAEKTSDEIMIASSVFKKEKFMFWGLTFCATAASWISRYLVINCILNAFFNLNLLNNIQILGKQLVLWLLMMISPTPGGSGVAEYAFGELMATFSTSIILISGLAVLWRLISYFPYLFIGALILPKWLKKSR